MIAVVGVKTGFWKGVKTMLQVNIRWCAAFIITAGLAGAASAATILSNGQTVDGWTISAPAGVALVLDSTSNNTITLEKFAEFTNTGPLTITFTQAGSSPAAFVDIANETVTNASGSDWSSFMFSLSGTSENGSYPSFHTAQTFTPPTGGGVDYTGVSLVGSNTPVMHFGEVVYTGSQPNLTTSIWGALTQGDLIFATDPSSGASGQTLSFIEQPGTGDTTPPVIVSQPASASMCLLGLGGLLAVSSYKKVRRTI
jgi:hypothetical protein